MRSDRNAHVMWNEDVGKSEAGRSERDSRGRSKNKNERGEVRGRESHDGNSDLLGERAISRLEGRRCNL